jgi:Glu-tRNA(Gln) amidotransferase subunit E-like FAD-binding protein
MKKTMQLLFNKHQDWVNIVKSFGVDEDVCEDIVQEMYYKIQLKLEKGLDIMYNETEINYYYIFKTLRSLFLDLKRKSKNIQKVQLEQIKDLQSDIIYDNTYEKVEKELNRLYWYDRKVFEIITSGESIASLSRKTTIQYYSLYNTFKKVKEKIKKIL